MKSLKKEKLSILNVKTIEEEILLIKESEKRGWRMNAKKAYVKGLDFIHNLKI